MKKRVGILTAGGDCPGLNATIRGVAKALYVRMGENVEIIGILNGYHGLINGDYKKMQPDDFRGLLTLGGTILGTKRTPFKMMQVIEEDKIDKVAAMKKTYNDLKLDCLLCLGGNGTHKTANLLSKEGLNIIGLPLTIDSYTQAAMDAVDRLYRTVSLKPGVEQMLARLDEAGAKMCVCSATWQFMCQRVLGRLGVLDRFQFVLSAQEGRTKHQPDIFFEALGRMGGADPAQCMVCEDALYAARTARQAGFDVIGIADAASRPDEAALRALSCQYLTQWDQLDWAEV